MSLIYEKAHAKEIAQIDEVATLNFDTTQGRISGAKWLRVVFLKLCIRAIESISSYPMEAPRASFAHLVKSCALSFALSVI